MLGTNPPIAEARTKYPLRLNAQVTDAEFETFIGPYTKVLAEATEIAGQIRIAWQYGVATATALVNADDLIFS